MSNILLSILIPTVIGREENLDNGIFKSSKEKITSDYIQGYCEIISDNIEIIILKDNKEMTIGEKRELLYKKSNGLYSWQIDDDDDISDDGIDKILEAIKQNADCITFEEYVNIDGKEYKSNHSLQYENWDGDGNKIFSDGFHFHRTPFFKSVIKTEIAKSVPVPYERFGEDHHWAQALKPNLKTEVHIPEQIYRYLHISSDFNERYGIKQ